MKKFFRVFYDALVLCTFVFFIVAVYKRFWLPESRFLP